MTQGSIKIEYSDGNGKAGQRFAYVRPSGKCHNRSRRFSLDDLQKGVVNHFPEVHYYSIGGLVIGAKNEEFALAEYWRVCEKENIGVVLPVQKLAV